MRFYDISIALVAVLCPVFISATSCDIKGGYAVRKPDHCDGDTPVDCGGWKSKRCCPNGFYCKATDNAYCCPKDEDCFEDVDNVPKCPDGLDGENKGFSIWQYNNSHPAEAWCCAKGAFGVALLNEYGNWAAVACSSRGIELSATSGFEHVTATSASYSSTCTTVAPSTTSDSSSSSSTGSSSGSQETGTKDNDTKSNSDGDNQNDSKDKSSISKGAIAGIVVGVVAGLALIGGAIFFLFRRRRSPRQPKATELDSEHIQSQHTPSSHHAHTVTPPTVTSSAEPASAYSPPPHIFPPNQPLELDAGGPEIREVNRSS